eukprot:SAG25_NODE_5941_length_603_cov_1.944444_1_plen_22_part_10
MAVGVVEGHPLTGELGEVGSFD